jgi:hypothetical protein
MNSLSDMFVGSDSEDDAGEAGGEGRPDCDDVGGDPSIAFYNNCDGGDGEPSKE